MPEVPEPEITKWTAIAKLFCSSAKSSGKAAWRDRDRALFRIIIEQRTQIRSPPALLPAAIVLWSSSVH